MDKHEPCEHEINIQENENVTVAEVHAEADQQTDTGNELMPSDTADSEDKKQTSIALKNEDDDSNLSPTLDHSLKSTNSAAKDDKGSVNTSATPKIMLHRSNVDRAKLISLPKANCKEKIILCVDNSSPLFSSQFKRTVQSIKQSSVFDVLVGSLKQFIMTKCFLNKKHEFSLLVLNETAQLMTKFMDEGTDVMFRLQEIANNCPTDDNESNDEEHKDFDLTNLFDLIAGMVDIPSSQSPKISPPPYSVRVILVYGRSRGNLHFKGGKESYEKLTQNPYFFIDCLYIHDDPAENNNVTDIFSCLCELDSNGLGYVLEVSTEGSMSGLYNAFAKLCCHPLQRQLSTQAFDFLLE